MLRRLSSMQQIPMRCGISLGLALLLTCGAAPTRSAPRGAPRPQSLQEFVKVPSLQSWASLEGDVRAGRYDMPESAVAEVLEYHSAREKRDLPNSMVLSGTSPGEFVEQQVARADAALARMGSGQEEDLWPLLQAMASQTFDDGLAFTAAEIAARLAPLRFEQIANVAVKAHPDNAWVFERTRERWLRGEKE